MNAPGRGGRAALVVAVLGAFATIAAACTSSSDDDIATTTAPATSTPQPLSGDSAASPSPVGTGSNAAARTATPTSSPTATTMPPSPDTDLMAVMAADTGAVTDCDDPANIDKPCAELTATEESLDRGIATFGISTRAGGGYVAVYGRTQDGRWLAWTHTQQTFLLLFLPGEVRVCADGDNLNIRAEPRLDAAIATGLEDDVIARAEQFVMDTASDGTKRGFGWYQLSAPISGWAHSEYLSNALQGDCTLRNLQAED